MSISVDLLPFVLVCALPFLLYVVAEGCALYLATRRRRPLEEARGPLTPEELDDLAKVGITIVQHP